MTSDDQFHETGLSRTGSLFFGGFVVYVASANSKEVLGMDVRTIKDATGKVFGPELYAAAQKAVPKFAAHAAWFVFVSLGWCSDPRSARWARTPTNNPTNIQVSAQKCTVNPKIAAIANETLRPVANLDSSVVKCTPRPLVG